MISASMTIVRATDEHLGQWRKEGSTIDQTEVHALTSSDFHAELHSPVAVGSGQCLTAAVDTGLHDSPAAVDTGLHDSPAAGNTDPTQGPSVTPHNDQQSPTSLQVCSYPNSVRFKLLIVFLS